MRSVLTLVRKEFRQLFLSPIAYAFLLVFVVFVTWVFFLSFFVVGETTMTGFFTIFPWAFAVVIPGVTMRTWAEERKQGTIEFLLTAPIETWHIVLAKFLGGLTLIALCLLLTIGTPITVAAYGDLDLGPVWGGYIGALLMGGACIAITMFLSAFTQDQVVAFLAGVVVLVALVLLGSPVVTSEFGLDSWFGTFAQTVGLTPHFESIGRGVIDVRDVYYFVATIALFLYLNARVIDLRRWR